MGSGWENEVKEILERAKVLEHQTKNRQRAAITLEERRRINPVRSMYWPEASYAIRVAGLKDIGRKYHG